MEIPTYVTDFLNSVAPGMGNVIMALIVLIIGLWAAKAVKKVIKKLLLKSDFDNKIFRGVKAGFSPEDFIANLIYYILVVLVLMIVLDKLGVNNVLDPLKNMVNEFVTFIPNIIGAGIIGFAGYLIAKIASDVVGAGGNWLESASSKAGLKDDLNLGKIIKNIVFIAVFVPILIVALDTLELKAISEPATAMLGEFTSAIPNIIVAALIITVFYIGGKFLIPILVDLLKGLGVDELTEKLGLLKSINTGGSASKIIGNIAFFFLMFFGILTAIEKLEFTQLSDILKSMLELSGQIFFGLVILGIGSFLSNLAYKALAKGENTFMASLARVTVIALFLAISLRTMGIANDIINLAFGLTLGAVAVAFALSFGLGGRKAAGKQMEHFLSKFRGEENK